MEREEKLKALDNFNASHENNTANDDNAQYENLPQEDQDFIKAPSLNVEEVGNLEDVEQHLIDSLPPPPDDY